MNAAAKTSGPAATEAASAPAPWLLAQQDSLLRQRGHAWLLHGPAGLGQWELALALVRSWLCEADDAATAGACGHCASCHAIDIHTHADLLVLMPEVQLLERGWPLPEKAQAEIDEKKRKPSKDIRVDALRQAVEFCQRTSARGRGKAVLVYPAEAMNTIAANTLLKTLEEPVGNVRFVLATEAAHQLLPTIRSRCLAHTMVWPALAAAQAWLQAQGVPADAAATALRAAGGSPAQALALARSPTGLRLAQQLPQWVREGDLTVLGTLAPQELLLWLHKLCHDLMCVAQGAAPRYFLPQDLPRPPALRVLLRWAQALAQALRTAEHPFQPALMVQALVVQARSVLHSKS